MSNIALLIPSLARPGGAEKLVDSLTAMLNGSHRVVQISFDGPTVPRYFDNAAEFVALGPLPRLPLALRWVTYATLAFKLWRLKQNLRIDLTISCLWGADLISILSGGGDKKIALGLINVVGNPTNRLMVQLRPLVAFVYRRFDRTLCISKALASEIGTLYKLPQINVGVFRNFLDFVEPSPVFRNDGIRRYVFCGRMVFEKNVDGLLAAWSVFSKARSHLQLVVIGDGPLLVDMKEYASALGIRTGIRIDDVNASVLFIGSVAQPQNYMANAHAFLLTSRHEGVPTVLILALSLGLPVLAADCHSGGVREMLQSDENDSAGQLLPIPDKDDAGSVNAWVTALDRVDGDAEQRSRWVRGARQLATHYEMSAVRDFWLSEIDVILKS